MFGIDSVTQYLNLRFGQKLAVLPFSFDAGLKFLSGLNVGAETHLLRLSSHTPLHRILLHINWKLCLLYNALSQVKDTGDGHPRLMA